MAYGDFKMNTQAPMPMRPGIGTLPKAGGMNPMATGGMNPMATGGMGPMTNRGVNPMQGGLMQGLAAQGSIGDNGVKDTELAHVNPQEAALLKALGGSGTINPRTGLREYWHEGVEHSEGSFGWTGDPEGLTDVPLTGGDPVMDIASDPYEEDLLDPPSPPFDINAEKYPGNDADYKIDMKSRATLLGTLYDLLGLRQDIDKNYMLGGQSWRKKYGLLGTQLSDKYRAGNVARRFREGKGGVKFGESVGPERVSDAKFGDWDTGINTLRGEKLGLDKQYSSEVWDVLGDARLAYATWLSNLTSPEYKSNAISFEQLTQNMDWLKEPTT